MERMLMPGKLSRTWRAAVEDVYRRGVFKIDFHKRAYTLWLIQNYGKDAVKRHFRWIDRAMTSIAQNVYEQLRQAKQRETSRGL